MKKLTMILAVLLFALALTPAAAVAAEIGTGAPVFKVNTADATKVGFDGKQWVVVGYDSVGSTARSDTLTLLLAKGQRHSDAMFRAQNNGVYEGTHTDPHDYNDSDLQKAMDAAFNGIASQNEQGLIDSRSFTGAADGIAGADVPDAKFWPLSKNEADTVNANLRSFDTGYWLRSPALSISSAAVVESDGSADDPNGLYVYRSWSVRPAFNLKLSSVLFTSAAVGGKGAIGSGLLQAAAPGGAVKFTVKVAGLDLDSSTTTVGTVNSGDTVDIPYTNATTGANNYVSCVIEDSAGKVMFYGKLAPAQNTASGTASFTVPAAAYLANGNYKIKLFAEEANGDNLTDFCSEPIAIAMFVANEPAANGGGTPAAPSSPNVPSEPIAPDIVLVPGDSGATIDLPSDALKDVEGSIILPIGKGAKMTAANGTEIDLPPSTEIAPDGTISMPAPATAATGGGAEVNFPAGTKIASDGAVTVPDNSVVTISAGASVVTVSGAINAYSDSDGKIALGESTIRTDGGARITIIGGGTIYGSDTAPVAANRVAATRAASGKYLLVDVATGSAEVTKGAETTKVYAGGQVLVAPDGSVTVTKEGTSNGNEEEPGGSGSGGCSAAGAGMAGMLGMAAALFRKQKSKTN